MILVWLLEANYTLNILVFLYWWQIILGTFPFFFTGGKVADTYPMFTKYSKYVANSLYNASYYMCRKITSHWQPLFSKKMAETASFYYKIGGSGPVASFSYKIDGGGKYLATLLAAILTWSGYWSNLRQLKLLPLPPVG